MTSSKESTYQMLWNCPFCGTEKLLGLTHRHCPGCGSAQDETARYFPSDEDKIRVEDHEYVGADRDCPACSSPNSAAGKHCVNCGSPMDGAAEVARVLDEAPADPSPEPRRSGGGALKLILGGVVLAVVALVLLAIFAKRPVELQASEHRWERTIAVEVYGAKSEQAWCDAMPRDAYGVTRSREVRSHDKVPDGQTCTTKRRDNGDGSFTEYEDCKPKFKEVPVYDERCRFSVDRWQTHRTAEATGPLQTSPAWPEPNLKGKGQCKGCEREGSRSETYTVSFTEPEGKTFDCSFPQERWASIEAGSGWTSTVGMVTGALDCGSLEPVP